MHELSLCNAIATTVREHAADRAVDVVRLRIGHFRQVVPDTLHFCWRNTVLGGPLDGAALEIVDVPAVVTCRSCGADTTLDEPLLRCAACGAGDVDLISGEEFLIDSIDVRDPAPSAGVGIGDR